MDMCVYLRSARGRQRSESSRLGGHCEHQHVSTSVLDMPSAMPIQRILGRRRAGCRGPSAGGTPRSCLCVDVRGEMCVDTCVDMCVDTCIDMCSDMCIDMCEDMFVDMCVDMCIDMCGEL